MFLTSYNTVSFHLAGKYHQAIQITNDSTGHSYRSMFTPYLDELVTEVHIEDPYIRSSHQIYNLLRFCELLVMSVAPVKRIHLLTGRDEVCLLLAFNLEVVP